MNHPVLKKSEIQKNSSLILVIASLFGLGAAVGGLWPVFFFAKESITTNGIVVGLFGLALFYKCAKEISLRIKRKKSTDENA